MTVHRRNYRPYSGDRPTPRHLFWTIARRELRLGFRKAWVRRLLFISAVPMLFFMAMLYVRLVVEQAMGERDILGISLFESFYDGQVFFVVLMMAALGADSIAKDISSGALHLYFCRPLSRAQYLLGKLVAVAMVLELLILVPGLLLALAQLLLAPDQDYGAFVILSLQIAAYGAVLSVAGSAIIVCLSAFGKRARYVGAVWVALYFFSAVGSEALIEMSESAEWARLLSIQTLFRDSGRFFYGSHSVGPLAVLVLLACLALAVLYVRIGGLERSEG